MSYKGKIIRSKERNIINNITKFFEREADLKQPLIPISNVQKRVAAATGVSLSTIQRIKREALSSPDEKLITPGQHKKRPEYRNALLDIFDLCEVRNTVHEFYKAKKIPSLVQLLPVLREKIKFHWGKETLRKILPQIGFQWKMCQNRRKVLIERPEIVAWRFHYLREMKQYRESKRNIVFLDETMIDNNLAVKNCWQDHNLELAAKGKVDNCLIVVHAGSSSGFIPNACLVFVAGSIMGDSQRQLNYENFEKWVKENVLPNIPAKSVICMDNAPYHTKVLDPVPSKYASKKSMFEWLEKKGISYDPNMRKSELVEIITANVPLKRKYSIDELLKKHGHDVLRIPPYHCDLNAIELAWASVKRYVCERNANADLSLMVLNALTTEAIHSITPNDWQKYCECVSKVESMLWEADSIIDSVFDDIILQSETNSISDSETCTESDEMVCGFSDTESEEQCDQVIKFEVKREVDD